jgi:hypothetical protein
MKANTTATTGTYDITTTKTADQQAAEVGMGVIVAFTALSGLWGATCLLSALAQHGVTAVAAGWLQAIFGG